jgi:hypothetical protein
VKIDIRSECLFLILTLIAIPMSSQKGLVEPPAKLEVAKHPLILERPVGPQPQKVDFAKLQRDALDLAQLAQSITTDVDHAAHGTLAKDFPDKLKRIEKLSKHLRNQLTP